MSSLFKQAMSLENNVQEINPLEERRALTANTEVLHELSIESLRLDALFDKLETLKTIPTVKDHTPVTLESLSVMGDGLGDLSTENRVSNAIRRIWEAIKRAWDAVKEKVKKVIEWVRGRIFRRKVEVTIEMTKEIETVVNDLQVDTIEDLNKLALDYTEVSSTTYQIETPSPRQPSRSNTEVKENTDAASKVKNIFTALHHLYDYLEYSQNRRQVKVLNLGYLAEEYKDISESLQTALKSLLKSMEDGKTIAMARITTPGVKPDTSHIEIDEILNRVRNVQNAVDGQSVAGDPNNKKSIKGLLETHRENLEALREIPDALVEIEERAQDCYDTLEEIVKLGAQVPDHAFEKLKSIKVSYLTQAVVSSLNVCEKANKVLLENLETMGVK